MKENSEKLAFAKIECADNLSAVEDAVYVLGGKWKLRIIVALVSGYYRFNEIQRAVQGISPRVLSNELKMLELNGLVKRTVDSEKFPVLVEYLPTEYAETLKELVSMLGKWGRNHKKRITLSV
ncbi:DNA-binding HxlR family transcriptional regulator [Chryseobacterium sp. H1D6B]|uniref:winged helix-turn-helix transcriptional regulator n=1 Tax=Chryseobacterium sp. H1D6B TaxID=2940588 RepID=UPI0015CC5633|nr:helix-turn-helix domain-containing protein [Chryseobacterium sp. H1D6B]MDH6250609.1 DNA-binding HxlR family transcriptional regulator [Chryseobacterium sp. H1D6B]